MRCIAQRALNRKKGEPCMKRDGKSKGRDLHTERRKRMPVTKRSSNKQHNGVPSKQDRVTAKWQALHRKSLNQTNGFHYANRAWKSEMACIAQRESLRKDMACLPAAQSLWFTLTSIGYHSSCSPWWPPLHQLQLILERAASQLLNIWWTLSNWIWEEGRTKRINKRGWLEKKTCTNCILLMNTNCITE